MGRVITGWVLLLFGAFFLTVGFLTTFWVPGQVEKVPLNVDQTTYLSGRADKYDIKTGKVVNNPVKITDVTRIDPKRSDGTVAVWVETTCANIDTGNPADCLGQQDPRMISDSLMTYATDRHTGYAVNDPKYISTEAKYSGLMNKYPFNTEKKNYPYWDLTLGAPAPATYAATETLDGLTVYRFDTVIKNAKIDLGNGIGGIYNLTKSVWVEPQTGAIVDQKQHDVRTFADGGGTALDMRIAFTPDTVARYVHDAKANVSQLKLFTKTVPIIGYVLGVLLLAGGIALILWSRRTETVEGSHARVREPVS